MGSPTAADTRLFAAGGDAGAFRRHEANWRDEAKRDLHILQPETPAYIGRAVAALVADLNMMEKLVDRSAHWGVQSDFTDRDGSSHIRELRQAAGTVTP